MGTLFIFHNVRTEMEDLCYEKQFSRLGEVTSGLDCDSEIKL